MRALHRELRNLASAHPLARLEAIHELRVMLRKQLEDAFDLAELEQVRQARSRRPQPSWAEVGRALEVTGQHARRRFHDRL